MTWKNGKANRLHQPQDTSHFFPSEHFEPKIQTLECLCFMLPQCPGLINQLLMCHVHTRLSGPMHVAVHLCTVPQYRDTVPQYRDSRPFWTSGKT